MRLHAVISVVGAQLQKFRQVLMPDIKINGNCSLTHTELINRHRSVIDQTYPTNHSACGTLKAAYSTARCPHFAEIHTHPAAEF